MADLLDALGVTGRLARRAVAVAIWAGFATVTPAVALGTALAEARMGAGPLVPAAVVAAVWALWTVWHSVLFGAHRRRVLRTCARPYRRAFLVDLVPGLSVSFSQMLRPVVNGPALRSGAPYPQGWADGVRVGAGLLVCVAAVGLFAAAWRALGAARVGFVPEFVGTDAFVPERSGPYARVRHPLFWSGVFGSCGLAIVAGTTTAATVALVNAGYGLVYNVLEDRRLALSFGARYTDYARTTPRILPRRAPAGPLPGKAVP